MKDDIIVYTDGACSGNPGKGLRKCQRTNENPGTEM